MIKLVLPGVIDGDDDPLGNPHVLQKAPQCHNTIHTRLPQHDSIGISLVNSQHTDTNALQRRDPSLDSQDIRKARNNNVNGGRLHGKHGLDSADESSEDRVGGVVVIGAGANVDGSGEDVDAQTAMSFQESGANTGLNGAGGSIGV